MRSMLLPIHQRLTAIPPMLYATTTGAKPVHCFNWRTARSMACG